MNNSTQVESPTTLLHNSMQSSAKLAARARRLLELQLKSIEKELRDANIPPMRRMELTDSLITVMTALDRSVEQTGKLLTARHAPSITPDTWTHLLSSLSLVSDRCGWRVGWNRESVHRL